jgi:hypothetical protein
MLFLSAYFLRLLFWQSSDYRPATKTNVHVLSACPQNKETWRASSLSKKSIFKLFTLDFCLSRGPMHSPYPWCTKDTGVSLTGEFRSPMIRRQGYSGIVILLRPYRAYFGRAFFRSAKIFCIFQGCKVCMLVHSAQLSASRKVLFMLGSSFSEQRATSEKSDTFALTS